MNALEAAKTATKTKEMRLANPTDFARIILCCTLNAIETASKKGELECCAHITEAASKAEFEYVLSELSKREFKVEYLGKSIFTTYRYRHYNISW